MADETHKTLEMRVAELEDKLAKLNITEDEMKAYRKVVGVLGGGLTSVLPPGFTSQPAPFFALTSYACSVPPTSPVVCSPVVGVCRYCWGGYTTVLPPTFGTGGFGTLGS